MDWLQYKLKRISSEYRSDQNMIEAEPGLLKNPEGTLKEVEELTDK